MFSSRSIRFALLVCAGLLTFMTASVIEPGQAAPAADTNPLTNNWEGPYGGIPPFDKVKVSDFKPALEAAMAENLAEVEKIANDPAEPTFENTIAAMMERLPFLSFRNSRRTCEGSNGMALLEGSGFR